MEYFDTIGGGQYAGGTLDDIFGGLKDTEIFDLPSNEFDRPNESMGDQDEQDNEDSNDKPDNDSSSSDSESDDDSIIGHIQIGIHVTPIVGEKTGKGVFGAGETTSCPGDDILAPMDIHLGSTEKKEVTPDDVSDALFRLDV